MALAGIIEIKDNDISNWVAMAWEMGYGLPSAILIGKYFFRMESRALNLTKLNHLNEELIQLRHTISNYISPDFNLDTDAKIAELEIWRTKEYSSYFSMEIYKLINILRSNHDLSLLLEEDQNMIDKFLMDIHHRILIVSNGVNEFN